MSVDHKTNIWTKFVGILEEKLEGTGLKIDGKGIGYLNISGKEYSFWVRGITSGQIDKSSNDDYGYWLHGGVITPKDNKECDYLKSKYLLKNGDKGWYPTCDIGNIPPTFRQINENGTKLEYIVKYFIEKELGVEMSEGSCVCYKTDMENAIKNGIKQIILTGAPGTGKTYFVKEYVNKETDFNEDRYKFVQFHPSYDYTDFVEGLRPVKLAASNTPTFVRIDGTFKAFCRKIVEDNLNYAAKKRKENITVSKKQFMEEIYQENKKSKETKNEWVQAFNNGEKSYYFIVDEINRADLSKVFGELMFGLEESYRGIENRFDTQYKNLKTYKIDDNGIAQEMEFDCFEKGFFIPNNLVFIGTMNDIDRSVESFDFALRRRFQWIDIKANDIMINSLKDILQGKMDDKKINEIGNCIIEMNKILNSYGFGLSEAYHIGPAYFKDYDGSNIKIIFQQRIEPIIREYTRGRNSDKVDKLIKECKKCIGVEEK